MKNELKELEKLEATSTKISRILQDSYDVEVDVADQLSLYFLSNNFQAMKPEAERKARRARILGTPVKLWQQYWGWRKRKQYTFETFIGVALGVVCVISLLIFGLSKIPSPNAYPRRTAVAENYRLVGNYQTDRCFPSSNICVPQGSESAFDYQIENLAEGDSVEMMGSQETKITMTKKNKQVILVQEEFE